MQPEVVASIIAATTALIAVIIGPYLTLKAQKNQVLAPMRQAWINNLRDIIAEFISTIAISRLHVVPDGNESNEIKAEKLAADMARVELACKLKEKTALLINPKEIDHQELIRLLESAYLKYHNGEDINALANAIRDQAQKILKTEWNVVKR